MSARDDATVRASLRHADEEAAALMRLALRTVADYQALPGVCGVEPLGGQRVSLYFERTMTQAEVARLTDEVNERRNVAVLVTIKRCRRAGLTERRSPLGGGLPPIPPEARWE